MISEPNQFFITLSFLFITSALFRIVPDQNWLTLILTSLFQGFGTGLLIFGVFDCFSNFRRIKWLRKTLKSMEIENDR